MQISVTFKNLESSENLKDYVNSRLKRIDKYLYNAAEASVVLGIEKFRNIAEVRIRGDGLNINGREESGDMYSSIDAVVDKIEKQIKKNKQKNRDHRASSKTVLKGMIEE